MVGRRFPGPDTVPNRARCWALVLLLTLALRVPLQIKIKISAPQVRLYSTWIGGSILASLDTFKRMWVSRKEFEEEGPRVLHRRTFA